MGMDVHGINPKHNRGINDFPTMKKFDCMGFSEKWKILDKDKKLSVKYWKEKDEWEKSNPGVYFRNNCWWWRPLWDFCKLTSPDLISDKLWDSGHHNDGEGLNAEDAKLLGNRLMEWISDGRAIEYQAEYMQHIDDIPNDTCGVCNGNNRGNNKKKDCKRCDSTGETESFAKSYPFDVDNVEAFALFCIESGGFEIC